MNVIDAIILMIIGFFCVKGFFRGFIMEAFTLIGLVLAYIIALREMSALATLVAKAVNLPPMVITSLSFFIIFVLIVLFCRWIAGALKKIIKWTFLGWLDRGGGVLFGALKGGLVASLLALLISLIPFPDKMESVKENSFFFEPVCSVAPAVFNVVKRSFPQTKSFYEEVKESFEKTSKSVTDHIMSKHLEELQGELEKHLNKK
jgi:membrane protein required for colicin V production